jgi:hypothetical protein
VSRVDKQALHAALDGLQQAGVIDGWQARPLGMYAIHVLGGEGIRPDSKETAMWVTGVRYGLAYSAAEAAFASADESPAEEEVNEAQRAWLEAHLAHLSGSSSHSISGWSRTGGSDYLIESTSGMKRMSARDALWFVSGVVVESKATEEALELSFDDLDFGVDG